MASREDIDELKAKTLCHRCVAEPYLGAEMQREGQRGRCSYCGRLAKGYTIGELAERIEAVFDAHYVRLGPAEFVAADAPI